MHLGTPMTVSSKLRHILVTIFVCALTPAAQADFWPVEPNLKRLNLPQSLAKTSLRLQPLTPQGKVNNDCSAVVVSDQGHVLTAAHCLKDCLRKANAYKQESANVERLKPEVLPVECPVLISEKPATLNVLATADCLDAGETKALPDPSCVTLDVALGQIATEFAPVCAVLAPSVEVQYAFALSFPYEKTYRLRDGDVEEFKQFFSEGELIAFKPTCDKKVKPPRYPEDEQPGSVSLGPPEVIRAYAREVALGKQIQMTVDVVKGSSGAPIFDREGRVLGVAKGYAMKRHGTFSECAGATFMAPLRLADLRARFPSLNFETSTTCTAKRAR